jgi:hypothetical protein
MSTYSRILGTKEENLSIALNEELHSKDPAQPRSLRDWCKCCAEYYFLCALRLELGYNAMIRREDFHKLWLEGDDAIAHLYL